VTKELTDMALHEPVPVIDIGTALELRARVGSRGPLRLVLSLAGTSEDDIELLGDRSVRQLQTAGRLPVTLTLAGLVVLDAAERAQDRGYGKSKARAYVVDVAARYLEVLPDAAFGTVIASSCGEKD
jgi:hypothetical protein